MDKILKVAVILSAVDKMSTAVKGATDKSIKEMERLKKAQSSMAQGAGLIAGGVAGLAALSVPIQAAADFETKMADVRKVVNGLNDPTALAAFGGEIQQLGREIGMATNELVDLAAAGGRMDVPRESLISYVREVSKMSVAFDMAAGEAGENMGKIAKMFNIPIEQIGRLGDTINYLDDNSIAKGKEIMDVMLRSAGVAQQVGLADKNLAALSSTFLTLGSRPEVAANSINALMRELSIAEMQPQRFQDGLEKLGLSASKMQSMMKIDPQGTILQVLDKIKNSKQGLTLATQLFGKEYGDDITKLSQGVGEYRRQLELLNNTKLQGSMGREFDIRNQTFNAEMQKFANIVQELKVNFGMALLPMLKEFAEVLKPIASGVANFTKEHPQLMKFIGVFVGIGSAVMIAVGAFKLLSGAMMMLSANPIVLIVAAVVAAVAAIIVYRKEIMDFAMRVWKIVTERFQAMVDFVKGLPAMMYEAGKNIVQSIIDGITAKATALVEKVKGLAKEIRDFFPFSPAKRGPLMDIHKIKFAETLAMAIKPQPVMKAVGAVAGAMATGPKLAAKGGAGGGGNVTFAPVINLSGSATQSDARMITDALKTQFKQLMDDYNRGKARVSYS